MQLFSSVPRDVAAFGVFINLAIYQYIQGAIRHASMQSWHSLHIRPHPMRQETLLRRPDALSAFRKDRGTRVEAETTSTATPVSSHTREEGCLLRELFKTELHLVESLVKPLIINSSKK